VGGGETGIRAPQSVCGYFIYAREHWSNSDENPPIGLILCSEHDAAVAHYALGNLGNKVLARELTLPTEEELTRRLKAKRRGENWIDEGVTLVSALLSRA
jgi:hypothetical protein